MKSSGRNVSLTLYCLEGKILTCTSITPSKFPLPPDATNMIGVALIVAQHIGAVEHHDPAIFCVTLEGRG